LSSDIAPPTSLWDSGKGRCGCSWILEALIVVPTSLKRGEGQMVGMKFVD